MLRCALFALAWTTAVAAQAAPRVAVPTPTAAAVDASSARFDTHRVRARQERPEDRESARPNTVLLGLFGGTVHRTFPFPEPSGAVVGLEASWMRDLRRGAFALRATLAPAVTTAAHFEGRICSMNCGPSWWNWSHGRALVGLDARPAPDRAGGLTLGYSLGLDVARTQEFGTGDETFRVAFTPAHALTLGLTHRPWGDRPTRFTLGAHHGPGGARLGRRGGNGPYDTGIPQVTPTWWFVVGVTTGVVRY